ncbi:MAG: UDP-glucose/GDP-mannose dehydrogenase family protein [Proteobacteria bacterium]|nr:UDP-glucose/GDP-mannose dehydrogenase family protein [Pseudomonadota bacterium]
MKIAVIGTGYVGLVSGACFSEFGFSVACVDSDQAKIASLKQGKIPIYESGLDDLVARNTKAKRLSFTTDTAQAVKQADAVFIAVGTPARRGDGHADLTYVQAAAKEIAQHITGYTVVVTKSTVPVGTGREVAKTIHQAISTNNSTATADIVSNPEFLREGSAIEDFMRPDRVVVGAETEAAQDIMRTLYRPLFLRETPMLFTSLESAELIKYASNAFLATKISFINQMADLCETLGADIHHVATGMGLDKRIGAKFLHAGPGYGGSCFPKDTQALIKTAEAHNAASQVSLISEVVRYNEARKQSMADRIIKASHGTVKGKTIAILGLAFKPETDDTRDSPALTIIPLLHKAGAKIKTYDPAAMPHAKPHLPANITYCQTALDTVKNADISVIITEWNEFRALAPTDIAKAMAGDTLVDLRNIYDPEAVEKAGLRLINIGKKIKQPLRG